MPDFGRIARVAIPVAVGLGAVVAAPIVAHAVADDHTAPPTTAPPAPPPLPAGQAGDGAAHVTPPAPQTTEPAPAPAPARRTYANPVFAEDAPDPSVVRAEDGSFYAYTTEGHGLPFQVLHSKDLVSWERAGAAFEGAGPAWIKEHRWAPDVKRTGDHYTMVYSGRGDDGRMRIGYATAKTAAGPFQDRGILVDSHGSTGFTIDPDLVEVEPGKFVLYYGSTGGNDGPVDGTGIKAVGVELAADGTMTANGAGGTVLPEAGDRTLVEGAWVTKHGDEWYMFYSDGKWDAGAGSDEYNVKVAKGPSPLGPFTKKEGAVLHGAGGFSGTGHNSMVTDDDGQDWMIYHAWGADRSKGRVLMMDKIEWKDGWPVVNGGNGASTGTHDAPVVTARVGASTLAPR
ncbi:MAG: glycoside hydrolase family 43 [Thermoleophilia bacterium]|nr:glycoside hydrolase family 43 [Thermoleophilia bacterium]